MEKAATFVGGPGRRGVGVGMGWGVVLQETRRPTRPGGVGRALVAAVDWVTGRRAGAPELLTGEGEAPGCLGASVPPRPRRWSSAAAKCARPPSSIGGWVCMSVWVAATSTTRVS